MFFNLPNYSFSIYACHCKLHCDSLSLFFFFLVVSMTIFSPGTSAGAYRYTDSSVVKLHSCLFLPTSVGYIWFAVTHRSRSPRPCHAGDIPARAAEREGRTL